MDNYPDLPDYAGEYRPTLISIICIVGIIFNILAIVITLTISNKQLAVFASSGINFNFIHLIDSVIAIIAYIGLWKMQLWAALLYFLSVIAMIAYHFVTHDFLFWALIPSVVALLIVLYNVKNMSGIKK